MKRNVLVIFSVAACFATLPTAFGCQVAGGSSAQDKAGAAELGPDSSVTIVPVVMAGAASKDVAGVVGIMLEQEGMPNIWTSDAVFEPDQNADLAQVASSFGEWAAKQDFETEYVLFAQILGSPARGASEVRAVITDAVGRVLWTDRQTPEDRDFGRVKPRNPMACCVLLKDRLRPRFHLTSATRGRVKDGRMARSGREESGVPSKEEFAAMKQRVEFIQAAFADSNLLVYPMQTLDGANAAHAANLVQKLNKEMDAQVSVADTPLDIEIAPSSNEQKRLWDLARGFRAHVRKVKPDADYTLVAEYLIRPSDKHVWTVHFVLCDRAGNWVIVDFQNNHHDDFNAINPKTTDDCGDLVLRRFAGYLK